VTALRICTKAPSEEIYIEYDMLFPVNSSRGRITCRLRDIFRYRSSKSPFSPNVYWL